MTKETILASLKELWKEQDFTKYEKLVKALEDDIRVEVEKKKGTKASDLTIIKRIIKHEKDNAMFGKYHPLSLNGKDYKCFTEGRYILASENDFGYEKAENPFTVDKFFDDNYFNGGIEIKVDIVDLKTFLKTNKPKKNSKLEPYIFENDKIKIGFNPQFLLDTLEFCKSDTIIVTKPIAPAYIKSDDMERIGLVLPVNLKYHEK